MDIKRIDVLNAIYDKFQMVTQYPLDIYAIQYRAAAEALIALLEVKDCGSIGGHDPRNKLIHHLDPLFGRFLTVIAKHHTVNDIKLWNNITVDTLGEVFVRMYKVRGEVYNAQSGSKCT